MSKITKLGVGIVAFEGTEHIKNIAYEFKRLDAEVIVCLQEISYRNNIKIDQYDIDEVQRCVDAGLVDRVVWYSFKDKDITNAKKSDKSGVDWPRLLECNKRNMLIDELEKDGCSQAIILDADEYYTYDDLKRALEYYDKSDDTTVTYCQYINYWQDYSHYLIWDRKTYVPFVADIKHRFRFDCQISEFSIDKSRTYNLGPGDSYSVIQWDALKMHHLSWVRLNIDKKVDCWSSGEYYTKEALDFIKEKYRTWNEWENAFVTFRVPLRPVCVSRYDTPFIEPHYQLYEKC